ncbi:MULTISPECIES: IclR family transcriptional regulator [unclassified Kribbella]|uniref:IclR family transcriptional regulator n=1 Tax=unclassified Kribbella TaxID=2644121 RepID=UPI003018BD9E
MDDHTVAGRMMDIIETVAMSVGAMSLARLTAETGLPKATVRRIANNLVGHRMLQLGPDGYQLGFRLLELGKSAQRHIAVAEFAGPFLQELSQTTGQITWAGIVTDEAFVVADTAFTPRHSPLMASATNRDWMPRVLRGDCPSTAVGQLMIALDPDCIEGVLRTGIQRATPYTVTSPHLLLTRLRRTAETGLATEYEESRLGWWCGATLVPGSSGTHIVGVTAETKSLPPARGLQRLQKTADELGRALQEAERSPT